MIKYYTLAKKIHQVYGHGDNGTEYHICPIDAYHTDSKKFHPLFKSVEEAEKYKSGLKFNFDLEVVELSVSEKRENGFYWVKYGLDWTIGEYCGDDGWNIIGLDHNLKDKDFEYINEGQIQKGDFVFNDIIKELKSKS